MQYVAFCVQRLVSTRSRFIRAVACVSTCSFSKSLLGMLDGDACVLTNTCSPAATWEMCLAAATSALCVDAVSHASGLSSSSLNGKPLKHQIAFSSHQPCPLRTGAISCSDLGKWNPVYTSLALSHLLYVQKKMKVVPAGLLVWRKEMYTLRETDFMKFQVTKLMINTVSKFDKPGVQTNAFLTLDSGRASPWQLQWVFFHLFWSTEPKETGNWVAVKTITFRTPVKSVDWSINQSINMWFLCQQILGLSTMLRDNMY